MHGNRRPYAKRTGHNVALTDEKILKIGSGNYHKGVFLEMLHFMLNKDSVNEHKQFPNEYLMLSLPLRTHRSHINSATELA